FLVAAVAGGVTARAASPVQFYTVRQNDPTTSEDNFLQAVSLRWHEDSLPVQWTLYRTPSEFVLLPQNNPDDMDSADVRDMIVQALEEWNDAPGTSLEFK